MGCSEAAQWLPWQVSPRHNSWQERDSNTLRATTSPVNLRFKLIISGQVDVIIPFPGPLWPGRQIRSERKGEIIILEAIWFMFSTLPA